MITGRSKVGAFIIATPTKCATTTLEELARRHRGGRAGEPLDSYRIMDWEKPRRQHRMVPPVVDGGGLTYLEWAYADRYITVRNPYSRWVSVYEYLRAPHNYSKSLAREIQGNAWPGWDKGRVGTIHDPMNYGEFLALLTKMRIRYSTRRWQKRRGHWLEPEFYRSPWIWLDGLDRSVVYLGEDVHLLRVEQLWDGLDEVKARYQLDSLWLKRSIHANKTLTYPVGEGDPWPTYYGEAVQLCGPPNLVGREGMECAYVKRWDGPCPSCRAGLQAEALALGYLKSE